MKYLYRLSALSFHICLLLFLFPGPSKAAAGDLDPTYGNGGTVTGKFFGKFDGVGVAAVTPDGKLVAVCSGQDADRLPRSCLVRYRLNGTLDPSFGSNGVVTVPFGLLFMSLAVQPDGKIVAAGVKEGSDGGDFAVARYNRDGSPDTSFGVGGLTTADFFTHTRDLARDVALQPDGKIVAAGVTDNGFLLAVARFNPDGSLDASFGDGGRVAPGLAPGTEIALGVAIQPDLKIVAAGEVGNGAPTRNDFVLVRFKPDGHLDETFGNGGKVFTDFGNGFDAAWDVVIQADGKIIASGRGFDAFALARYNADASPHMTFGNGGKVTTTFSGRGDNAFALALQLDGKIVAAGNAVIAGGDGLTPVRTAFALARYNPDGSLDSSFGSQGKVVTEFGEDSNISGLVIQPDGKLVATGRSGTPDGDGAGALARYLTSPTNAPVLQTEAGTNRAVALDSVTLTRDPFTVHTEHNFAPDLHTRILLFATSLDLLPGEGASVVTAQAEDARGSVFPLAVEHVGKVPGFEWLTQVVVRLPDELEAAGDVQVSVSLRGAASNKAIITIQAGSTPP